MIKIIVYHNQLIFLSTHSNFVLRDDLLILPPYAFKYVIAIMLFLFIIPGLTNQISTLANSFDW